LPEGVVFRTSLPAELTGTIWVVGGRQAIHSYLAAGLVDALELFIMPTLLGTGIPLFTGGTRPAPATLTDHTVYPNGVVRLLYRLKRR
jgi:dihydrofolate reductase